MKKFIYFGFVASLCGSTLSGCNGGDTGIANSESKAAVYLPYDIDNTGCAKRFYANDENSIHVEIPSTYSIDGAGRIISGGAYQIKSIGDYCFANNNLVKSIFIPDSVTNIGRNAFYNCASLEKINISSFVVSIGDEALEGCSKLTKIEKTGGSGLLLSENDSMRSFSIPLSIKEIGSNVFNGWDNLYSLTINDGIIKIGDDSIKNNPQLAYVNIKSSLEDLGDNVFAACPLLTSLQWNESISGINFFKSQMISKFVVPDTILSIAPLMFSGWNRLQEISIPASVKALSVVFSGNSALRKITCANYMVRSLFKSISDSSELYDDDTMYTVRQISGRNVNYYYIPKTLTEIHVIGDGETIESDCFAGMSSLKSVYLPSSILSFGNGAFEGCSGLTDVHILTDYDWCYSMDYYTASDYGQVSKSTVNNPVAFASALKTHNGSEYRWYAKRK